MKLTEIQNELEKFEKNIKSIKNDKKLQEIKKNQILKTFKAFSKLNTIEKSFKEIITEPVKLAIISLYINKKLAYENFKETGLIWFDFSDICLYKDICDKIDEMDLYRIGFKHFRDYEDFEKDLFNRITLFLNAVNLNSPVDIEISIYHLTKAIYLLYIYNKFNLFDEIEKKYLIYTRRNKDDNEFDNYDIDDVELDIS